MTATAENTAENTGGAPGTGRVARVVGREYLHRRPDLRAVADRDLHHVEDHAVEVQEHARADVEAVVTVERRPDHPAVPNRREAFP